MQVNAKKKGRMLYTHIHTHTHAHTHTHTAVILEKWDREGVIKTFCISVLLNTYIDYELFV